MAGTRTAPALMQKARRLAAGGDVIRAICVYRQVIFASDATLAAEARSRVASLLDQTPPAGRGGGAPGTDLVESIACNSSV